MSTWTLAYDSFRPDEEGLREVLTATGNGYLCTRGAAEWADTNEVHYPGTYMHGGYNRATTIMAGRPVENEDLVNLPNWLVLKLRIGDEPIGFDNIAILSYRHEFDMRQALLTRTLRFRDRADRETTLVSRRFVSMADQHVAAIEWTITPENWAGPITIISALDGRVQNGGVARYRQLEGRHLRPEFTHSVEPDIIALRMRTRQSEIIVAETARTQVFVDHPTPTVHRTTDLLEDYAQQTVTFTVDQRVPVRVEKLVTFYSSRDRAVSEPLTDAVRMAHRLGLFTDVLERHIRAWEELWHICDIRVPNDDHVQQIVRLHIAHVVQVCSPHTVDLDAGVPARGLNGEAYRGHIFWDSLFIHPFLTSRLPSTSRTFLMYHYRRLEEARAAARAAGYRGAMFPWQSGSDGREETQVVHLNPRSGRWDPDLSRYQRHVNIAIFYNIWRYYQETDDHEFLWQYGAEMMLEIARFWSSIAHFNPDRERYEIHGVMGPDEFHEQYPDSPAVGLRNNAYTNVMVAWLCGIAQQVLDLLPAWHRDPFCARIGLSDDEIKVWADMRHKMFVPFHDETIISQFEGYATLHDLDWDAYRATYHNIQRLDRILKAEGDTPNRYKLSKQADTLMLWYLLSEQELAAVLTQLGYPYSPDIARNTIVYYLDRTTHGSTLSFLVHAAILANYDFAQSWKMLMTALHSDIGDIQGGTTKEGIHLGVMAGTLNVIQRGYLGMELQDSTLHVRPKPVDQLNGLSFTMQLWGTPLTMEFATGKLRISVAASGAMQSITITVNDTTQQLRSGEHYNFEL